MKNIKLDYYIKSNYSLVLRMCSQCKHQNVSSYCGNVTTPVLKIKYEL